MARAALCPAQERDTRQRLAEERHGSAGLQLKAVGTADSNEFLRQCVHEQNENLRQKITGHGYTPTHSQVLKASLAVEGYNIWHSSGEGGDRGMAAIIATTLHPPPPWVTQLTFSGGTESKPWD